MFFVSLVCVFGYNLKHFCDLRSCHLQAATQNAANCISEDFSHHILVYCPIVQNGLPHNLHSTDTSLTILSNRLKYFRSTLTCTCNSTFTGRESLVYISDLIVVISVAIVVIVNALMIVIGMWRSSNSNSTTFELWTFSTDSKFDKCRMRIHGKILVRQLISYAQTARECRQTCLFSNLTYHTNYSYWMCSIIFAQWCVTLY